MKNKKLAFVGVLATAAFALASCQNNQTPETKTTTTETTTVTTTAPTTTTASEDAPLSYAEFMEAENDEQVTIQAVIQDRCTWYNNAASFYLADNDGGYYVYNMPCTAEQYEELVPGTEVKVTGAKAEWKGEVEISFATPTEVAGWEIISTGKTLNTAKSVADISKTTLDRYTNQLVAVEVEVIKAAYTNHEDFTLAPAAGVDVYFQVKDSNNNEATYVVEAYLEDTQYGSDTYTAICDLSVGDHIKLEGFVYYWETPQLQVTSVTIL